MITVEAIPGKLYGGIKENDGGMKSNVMYLIYFQDICT
jgi:hypothetical protein